MHLPEIPPDFDIRDRELRRPNVFRASFNRFERINMTQAWSLLLTACRDDSLLGLNPATGWFFSLSLVAAVVLIVLQRVAIASP